MGHSAIPNAEKAIARIFAHRLLGAYRRPNGNNFQLSLINSLTIVFDRGRCTAA